MEDGTKFENLNTKKSHPCMRTFNIENYENCENCELPLIVSYDMLKPLLT